VSKTLLVEGMKTVYCIGDANDVPETKLMYLGGKQIYIYIHICIYICNSMFVSVSIHVCIYLYVTTYNYACMTVD
jgi:hypothetical protein